MAGILTRTQMVTEVLDNLSRSTSGQTRNAVTLSTRAVTWLDRAQVWISRETARQGIFLLTSIATASTVASQKDYAFPFDVLAVFSMRYEDGNNSVKVKPIMPWEFDDLVPRPASLATGQPNWYVPYKSTNTFELFPIPNAVKTLRLRLAYWPSTLGADSEVSDFSYADDVLIAKATEYGFRWLQEIPDASAWKKQAEEELDRVIMAERGKYPDWEPVARGFTASSAPLLGEYYNDPFVESANV